MSGILLVEGIHHVGKSVAIETLTNLFEYMSVSARVVSLSKTMQSISDLSGVEIMTCLSGADREKLRDEALDNVLIIAATLPVIFDMHFYYEDGGYPDYGKLTPQARHILTVRSDPALIYGRLSQHDNLKHPNRLEMQHKGIAHIRSFQEEDERVTMCFAKENCIPVSRVWNDFRGSVSLAARVANVFPQVIQSFSRTP
jgi:hypothetical protein